MGQTSESCRQKKESFSVMIINYDSVLSDVAEYLEWIERKEAEISKMPSVGLNTEQARSALAHHDVSGYISLGLLLAHHESDSSIFKTVVCKMFK